MEVKIPESVNIVELEPAPFKKYSEAKRWARDRGIVGVMSDADTKSASNPVNGKVDIAVLYGCVALGGIDYRAKTTVKIFTASPAASKAYSYEISNIEILKGYVGTEVQPRDKISIATQILLNGVCDVNGVPLLPPPLHL